MHHHKYSLSEIENMLPWERDVYIKKENERLKLLQQTAKHM